MILSAVLIACIALEHSAFFILESFLFQSPLGLKIFNMTRETAAASAVLAVNQGVYNGFLAAGLLWGLVSAPPLAYPVKTFFLVCVIVAGLVGGATASRSILLIQALPALLALVLLRTGY